MIDWTKPIELMDGTPVVLDPDGWAGGNPDRDGDYWIKRPDGERIASSRGGRGFASMCCNTDGSEEGVAIQIVRNRAEPANDELAELRAFKEAAIERFPELAEPETDGQKSEWFEQQYWDDRIKKPRDLALAAIAWARANPR